MTAPTHAIFGVFCAAIAGAPQICVIACAIGGLLPDIDHPQSSIGRLLFFFSRPINTRFGHRKLIHSFIVWVPPLIISNIGGWTIAQWVFIGANSHIIADAFNISGVKALMPFNERSVVCFKRDWRIFTGSVQEILFFIAVACLIPMMNYSYALGGPRKLINAMAQSPKITAEEYTRVGLKYCRVKGRFRWVNGQIDEVEWPVVGLEGTELVYWDGEQLVRKRQGMFLKSTLKQEELNWPIAQVEGGFCTVQTPSFWYDGKKWHYAKIGDLAFGTIKALSGRAPKIRIPDKDDSS